jgi:hypothetical protein
LYREEEVDDLLEVGAVRGRGGPTGLNDTYNLWRVRKREEEGREEEGRGTAGKKTYPVKNIHEGLVLIKLFDDPHHLRVLLRSISSSSSPDPSLPPQGRYVWPHPALGDPQKYFRLPFVLIRLGTCQELPEYNSVGINIRHPTVAFAWED